MWVTNSTDGTVTRIDPSTGRPGRAFPAIVGASGVAFGTDVSGWCRRRRRGRRPRHAQAVLKEIGVGGEPAAVAAGAGAVWVANRADGTVSKIDPETLAVTGVVPVGRGPAAIAAGTDGLGGERGRRTVPASTRGATDVESTALENPPRGLALAPGRVRRRRIARHGAPRRELKVVSAALDSVDPALAYAGESWGVLTMTNDGLVGFRKVGGVQGVQLVPDLATALPTPTDGGKTYTFELREESATRMGGSCGRRTSGEAWSGCSSSARRARRTTRGSSAPRRAKRASRATSRAASSPTAPRVR